MANNYLPIQICPVLSNWPPTLLTLLTLLTQPIMVRCVRCRIDADPTSLRTNYYTICIEPVS